jgi:hypothetical protein
MKKTIVILLLIIASASCMNKRRDYVQPNQPRDFDPGVMREDMTPVKSISGQVLYMPVYSNIPYQIDTGMFDMSAFVSIHNTDINSKLELSQVLYFNQDGKLVDDFLKGQKVYIEPLATKEFYIPYEDKSGTGANFLIEWIADTLITEPLIESVTLNLKPNNTVAIKSQGRIIKERK